MNVGAAFNLDVVDTFLRFRAEGTKEVASFFRSRSSGAAKTVAAANSAAAVGFAGNEGLFVFEAEDDALAGFAGRDGCGGAS